MLTHGRQRQFVSLLKPRIQSPRSVSRLASDCLIGDGATLLAGAALEFPEGIIILDLPGYQTSRQNHTAAQEVAALHHVVLPRKFCLEFRGAVL